MHAINANIGDALQSAGLDTFAAHLRGVPDTVQRALARAGLNSPHGAVADQTRDAVSDVQARVIDAKSGSSAVPIGKPQQQQQRQNLSASSAASTSTTLPASARTSAVCQRALRPSRH